MTRQLRKSARYADEHFSDPREVIDSSDLSDPEKIRLLESWQSDLIQLLKAVEENMPSANSQPGETAARLAQVTAAIAKVRESGQTAR
jgi:hypothetical protein